MSDYSVFLRWLPLAAVAMLGFRVTLAGPPLAIDDPGILDPGSWELIGAATAAGADSGDVYEFPVLDVSFGLSENTQLSAAFPYVFSDPAGESSDSDFGNLQLGFKWRFFNSENLQVAFAPVHAFGITLTAATVGIGDDTDVTFLPVNLEYALPADWRFNAELGYAIVKEAPDELGYGVALAHPLGSRTEIMFELYGASASDFDDNFLNYHVGFDVAMTEAMHFLFSVGSGLSRPSGEEKLDYDVYLGLQYFP